VKRFRILVVDEIVKLKKERLGLVFADGAIGKEVYTGRLHELSKRESESLKIRDNLSPEAQAEIVELENSITSIEGMLDSHSGNVLSTDFGIWGLTGDKIAPLGYNPWLETDCRNEIGQARETGTIRIEGTDLKMKAILPPEGFWLSENPGEAITKNVRAVLQKFGTRVYVFRDRIEVRGLIPTQIISASSGAKRSKREPIIHSTRRGG